jgi:hypothetical protein
VKCDRCAIKTEGLHIGLFVALRVGTLAVEGSVNKWGRCLSLFTREKFHFVLRGQHTGLASALSSEFLHVFLSSFSLSFLSLVLVSFFLTAQVCVAKDEDDIM